MQATYPSAEHRVIAARIETLPPFFPEAGGPVPEASQRALYAFVQEALRALYADPTLLFASPSADGVFTHRFNRAADKNPRLDRAMRSANKKLDDFAALLLELGATAEGGRMSASGVKIPKKSRGLMLRLGLAQGETPDVFAEGEHRGMFEALRRLAGREGTGPRTLWLCLFDPGHSYAEDVFAPLLGDGMAPLLAFLKENGYERGGDLRDGKLSLDYAKEYGKKPSPLKDAWAERTHGGISAMHYDYVAEAACLALRVPMLRELLERQEAMTPRVRAFAIRTFKRCDGCGYCTQTDKGGGRPRAFVKVSSGEDKALVCTLFPGFYACRTNVDEALAHDIQEFLLFVDCNFR